FGTHTLEPIESVNERIGILLEQARQFGEENAAGPFVYTGLCDVAGVGQRHLVGLIKREIAPQVHVTGESRGMMYEVRRGDAHCDNLVDPLPISLTAVRKPPCFHGSIDVTRGRGMPL